MVAIDRLRAIRSISDVPVLVTGQRLTPVDRTLALELGADAHIVQPFELNELWAQARAIERRQEIGRSRVTGKRKRGGYRFNGWTLRLSDRSPIAPTGSPVALSRSAYALLLAFLDAPGRALSREFLLHAMSGNEDVFDRSIDARVLRLRRALQQGMEAPERLIRIERGFGYVFDATVERLH
jgi:two-component system OmpR family response regulator